jgi:hypothetical protein
MLRRALLRSTPQLPGGMGGIVFFAKNGEADEWAEVCQRLGRGEDVIRITPGGRYGFNFMDFISSWGEGGERGPIPAVALLEEIASVLSPESAGGAKGENAFFYTALRIKMTQLVLLAQLARLPVSLALMNAISSSAPQTPAQGNDPAWREGSICWHALREARTDMLVPLAVGLQGMDTGANLVEARRRDGGCCAEHDNNEHCVYALHRIHLATAHILARVFDQHAPLRVSVPRSSPAWLSPSLSFQAPVACPGDEPSRYT